MYWADEYSIGVKRCSVTGAGHEAERHDGAPSPNNATLFIHCDYFMLVESDATPRVDA